ncbi:MAG TPA: hypothetical protein VLG16_01870 [Candidatus Saccharimonadales bacterium]|nr:hypothetical protein [Candidatus Saccharimonadales bacterium]
MKNYDFFPVDSNPAHQQIHEEIYDNNRIAHGSPKTGLVVLRPNVSKLLSVHTPTGKRRVNGDVVWGTKVPDLATFYATVHAVTREFWLPGDATDAPGRRLFRASGAQPIFDEELNVIGCKYFASDATKELLQQRIDQGVESEVYFGAQEDFKHMPHSAEWMAHHDVRVLGARAVTALDLPFDVFDLPSPDSNEQIHGFYESAGIPPETRSLSDTDLA